ncbi:hypothetical protein [Neobacillus drentensis]|uniref:hypothetical protein n=1 Tax=Neobacillus drentensis TaxID=220684 RepID=UPI002FFEB043
MVKSLFVYYGGKKPSGKWHNCDKLIAVDSAQAGIFDLTTFGRDDAIQYEVINVYDIVIDEVGLKYFAACSDMVASDAQVELFQVVRFQCLVMVTEYTE